MAQSVYQMDTRSEYDSLGTQSFVSCFTQFSSILTQPTLFTGLAVLITLIRNEILVFEKSWGAERRGKDKIDAGADQLLRGVGGGWVFFGWLGFF